MEINKESKIAIPVHFTVFIQRLWKFLGYMYFHTSTTLSNNNIHLQSYSKVSLNKKKTKKGLPLLFSPNDYSSACYKAYLSDTNKTRMAFNTWQKLEVSLKVINTPAPVFLCGNCYRGNTRGAIQYHLYTTRVSTTFSIQ